MIAGILDIRPNFNREPGPPAFDEAYRAFEAHPEWRPTQKGYFIAPDNAANVAAGGECNALGAILIAYLGAENAYAFGNLALTEGSVLNDLVAPLLGCTPAQVQGFLDGWDSRVVRDLHDEPYLRAWREAHALTELGGN